MGIEQTPATVPAIDGEWVITLNGRVMPESDSRMPGHDLPIEGRIRADGQLGDDTAVVEVYFTQGGVDDVHVHHLYNGLDDITYELMKADEQPTTGQQWETASYDPEATVEIRPLSEIEI